MRTKMERKNKNYLIYEHAITLISLVITIVVLIILASVAIYLSIGNNGIFTRAKQAKEATNKQQATEIINLKITTAQMNKYAEEQRMPTLKELSIALGSDDEIEYVTEESKKKASTEYNVPSESPASIYTKLNKYPYEFEINGQLQLASINETKIENENKVRAKLKRVILGSYKTITSKTFNVSSYEGYEYFTEENFACSPLYNIVGCDNQVSTEYYGNITYNKETGVVTFPAGYRNVLNGISAYCTAYLYYIEYTE